MAKEIKWHKASKAINSRSPLKDILVLHHYPVSGDRIALENHVDPGEYYITFDELKQLPQGDLIMDKNNKRKQVLKEVHDRLMVMLNTSIDNEHFFDQLDDYIEELERQAEI